MNQKFRHTIRLTIHGLMVLSLLAGCSPSVRFGLRPFYEPIQLDVTEGAVRRDLAYRTDEGADNNKHRLDFYHPRQPGWPTLVFVHGGSLTRGDKDLTVAGYDIYGNLGRFYAKRGIGVAVINYRLQPDVNWSDQVDDVAAAAAWVARRAPEYGGDGRLFLAGHSAGAWLVARLALDVQRLGHVGLEPADLAGVISVSGSGYDMRDETTWAMYGREGWWAKRFDSGDPDHDWREAASVVPLLEHGTPTDAPTFLLIHTTQEWPALGRQNLLLHRALKQAGVESELVTVTTDGHRRMLLAMSRDEKLVAEKILQLVTELPGEASQPARSNTNADAGSTPNASSTLQSSWADPERGSPEKPPSAPIPTF